MKALAWTCSAKASYVCLFRQYKVAVLGELCSSLSYMTLSEQCLQYLAAVVLGLLTRH